jgi:outer membrane protein assembly factor BamD (BamD/ComL family)
MDDVATGFGKLASARDAAARIATWEKSPEAKPFANLKADRAARSLLVQGRTARRAGDAKKAVAALEKLVHDFPKSRFTPRGRELLATLKPKK